MPPAPTKDAEGCRPAPRSFLVFMYIVYFLFARVLSFRSPFPVLYFMFLSLSLNVLLSWRLLFSLSVCAIFFHFASESSSPFCVLFFWFFLSFPGFRDARGFFGATFVPAASEVVVRGARRRCLEWKMPAPRKSTRRGTNLVPPQNPSIFGHFEASRFCTWTRRAFVRAFVRRRSSLQRTRCSSRNRTLRRNKEKSMCYTVVGESIDLMHI